MFKFSKSDYVMKNHLERYMLGMYNMHGLSASICEI